MEKAKQLDKDHKFIKFVLTLKISYKFETAFETEKRFSGRQI